MNEIRIGNKSDAIGLLDSLLSEARKNLVVMYSDWDELDIPDLIPGLEALKDALERDVI